MKGVFVGLATLDLIHYVQSFPLPDEKIQAEDRWIGAGGPAANAAMAFAALGGEAELVTALGPSPAAEIARRDLEANSVTVHDLAGGGDLAISSIVVDATGRRTVVSVNGAGFGDLSQPASLVDDADVVLTDGHHVTAALPLLDEARERGCHTVFDGGSRKPGTDDLLARVQFAVVSSAFEPDGEPEQTARGLLRPPVSLAAVSQGAGPIVGFTGAGPFEVEVPGREVVDTLGAGDVLHGAFSFHLCTSDDPVRALTAAAGAAAEACTVRGPRLPRQ